MATYDQEDHGTTQVTVQPGLVTYVQIMYVLHGVAVLGGVLTSATIVGNFIFSAPSIIAVIMNYIRRHEARGTWLESHFRWQLRTFWIVLGLWLGALLAFGWLALLLVGIPLLMLSFFLTGIWAAYRIVRGWLALQSERAMPL
jgi:uncharacterized membrane protein